MKGPLRALGALGVLCMLVGGSPARLGASADRSWSTAGSDPLAVAFTVMSLEAARESVESADEPAPAAPEAAAADPVGPAPGAAEPGAGSHVVGPGDTLWTISRRYGTSVASLAGANGITKTAILRPGRRLVLPAGALASRPAPSASRSGVHVVQPGETLSEIAERYGVRSADLVAMNGLASAHRLRAGQRLAVSGAAAARPAPRIVRRIVRVRPSASVALAWPARGVLTSRFGPRWRRHHDGVDIAAPYGSPVHAARAGQVVFAGWDGGYGRVVRIEHGGGLSTIYAHLSWIAVRAGEEVDAGVLIGRIGCTGHCTGPHLHFEVHVDGRAVDPLRYL